MNFDFDKDNLELVENIEVNVEERKSSCNLFCL